LNVKKLPGKPDIVIKKYKLVIFVDGEFWHGYNWSVKKPKIKNNPEYWIKKIEGNMVRDDINNNKLTNEGFTVLRFWEQAIRNNLEECVSLVTDAAKMKDRSIKISSLN